MVLKYR